MKSSEYIQKALSTDSAKKVLKKQEGVSNRMLHAAIGISTESGEIMDAFKRALFQGIDIDKVNLIEEMGDMFWYLALMSSELGVDFEETWKKNVEKLQSRYPKGFSRKRSLRRNRKKERKILEK